MAKAKFEGTLTDLFQIPEPERTDIIDNQIPDTTVYPVFNPGKEFKVKFQGNIEKFPPGETNVPIKFAIYLLIKFAPNEYDRPENKPRVLLDGKLETEVEEKPVPQERIEEIKTIKLFLDDHGVEYPDDVSISKLRDLRAKLNKKLKKDKPPK